MRFCHFYQKFYEEEVRSVAVGSFMIVTFNERPLKRVTFNLDEMNYHL